MAKCECCKLDMLSSIGCALDTIEIENKEYERIKVGAKHDFYERRKDEEQLVCHDCNAKIGNYHHWGCDAERCPKCHQQLISCSCKDIKYSVFDNEKDSLRYLINLKEIENMKLKISLQKGE